MTALLTEAEEVATTRRFLSLDDLRNLPSPDPLIAGLLYSNTLAELYGPPGSYKSFIALSMAMSVAAGAGGGLTVPEAHPVVYVAAEGAGGLSARASSWLDAYAVEQSIIDKNFHALGAPVQFSDADQMAALSADVLAVGARLVVFDTRARCTVGLEENSAKDAGIAVEAVESLRRMTGATVLTVHHSTKAGGTARGSSAWSGAVWSELEVKRDGRAMSASVTVAKHKDAESGNSTRFLLQPIGNSLAAFPDGSGNQFPPEFPVAPPEGMANRDVVDALMAQGFTRQKADRLIEMNYRVEGSYGSKKLFSLGS